MKDFKKIILLVLATLCLFSIPAQADTIVDSAEGGGKGSFYGNYTQMSATTQVSVKTIKPEKNQKFTDVWKLKGLTAQKKYTITTEEYDLNANKIINDEFKGTKEFQATEAEQTVNVEIRGNATTFAGHKLVTIGKVRDETGRVLLVLDNLKDQAETLQVEKAPVTRTDRILGLLPMTGEKDMPYLLAIGGLVLALILLLIWKKKKDVKGA